MCVFQKVSKLHKAPGRVQFELFEKLTSVINSKLNKKSCVIIQLFNNMQITFTKKNITSLQVPVQKL